MRICQGYTIWDIIQIYIQGEIALAQALANQPPFSVCYQSPASIRKHPLRTHRFSAPCPPLVVTLVSRTRPNFKLSYIDYILFCCSLRILFFDPVAFTANFFYIDIISIYGTGFGIVSHRLQAQDQGGSLAHHLILVILQFTAATHFFLHSVLMAPVQDQPSPTWTSFCLHFQPISFFSAWSPS